MYADITHARGKQMQIDKILVYRRTHTGDPDNEHKVFGYHDCMGSVRDWPYDAVIGIGGKHPWPEDTGIKEKVTWVGITPNKEPPAATDRDRMKGPDFVDFRGDLVTFEQFYLYDEKGPSVKEEYPAIYRYMFEEGKIPRAAILAENETDKERQAVYSQLRDIISRAKRGELCSARPGSIAAEPIDDPESTRSRPATSCRKA